MYALLELLPIYAAWNERQSDTLNRFTTNNCATESSRLLVAAIGEYVSIPVALYDLSKIYLVFAYTANQDTVGNAGGSESLKQVNTMTRFSYSCTLKHAIEFNVNGVGIGISKVGTGISRVGAAIGLFVQATGVPQTIEPKPLQSVFLFDCDRTVGMICNFLILHLLSDMLLILVYLYF